MIDHVSLVVRDVAACKAFYDAVFAPLDIEILHQVSAEQSGTVAYMGYGPRADGRSHQAGKPSFWIAGAETPEAPEAPISAAPMHIAFVAQTRAQVEAFHAAALAAGGADNGAPGVRPHYHPNYYGAFVLDPDGRNVEAVCHAPA